MKTPRILPHGCIITFTSSNPEAAGPALIPCGVSTVQIIEPSTAKCFLPPTNRRRLEAVVRRAAEEGLVFESVEVLTQEDWEERTPSRERIQINSLTVELIADPSLALRGSTKGAVRIIPGSGFGTARDGSTRLALELLQHEAVKRRRPRRILDFGTGSGILSIAACALYEGIVEAVDIDPHALENAIENVALNGYEHRINLLSQDRCPNVEDVDLILCNVGPAASIRQEDGFRHCLGEDGLLVLSGLTAQEAAELVEEGGPFREWHQVCRLYDGYWTAYLLQRRPVV